MDKETRAQGLADLFQQAQSSCKSLLAFFELLMREHLYVYACRLEGEGSAATVRLPCQKIDGRVVLPVFTKRPTESVNEEIQIREIPASDLFSISSTDVLINLGKDRGMLMSLIEMQGLVTGWMFPEKDSLFMEDRYICRLPEAPERLLSELIVALKVDQRIESAHIGKLFVPDQMSSPCIFIYVLAEVDPEVFEEIQQPLYEICQKHASVNKPIAIGFVSWVRAGDRRHVGLNDGMWDYLQDRTVPFYIKHSSRMALSKAMMNEMSLKEEEQTPPPNVPETSRLELISLLETLPSEPVVSDTFFTTYLKADPKPGRDIKELNDEVLEAIAGKSSHNNSRTIPLDCLRTHRPYALYLRNFSSEASEKLLVNNPYFTDEIYSLTTVNMKPLLGEKIVAEIVPQRLPVIGLENSVYQCGNRSHPIPMLQIKDADWITTIDLLILHSSLIVIDFTRPSIGLGVELDIILARQKRGSTVIVIEIDQEDEAGEGMLQVLSGTSYEWSSPDYDWARSYLSYFGRVIEARELEKNGFAAFEDIIMQAQIEDRDSTKVRHS